MAERKVKCVEDVLGEFGFRVAWESDDYVARFRVFQVVSVCGGVSYFHRLGATSWPDDVASIDEADEYISGSIKWDGCSDIDTSYQHYCSPHGLAKHGKLLRHLYVRAFELMGREPDEGWPE